jgi:hypothetical protein
VFKLVRPAVQLLPSSATPQARKSLVSRLELTTLCDQTRTDVLPACLLLTRNSCTVSANACLALRQSTESTLYHHFELHLVARLVGLRDHESHAHGISAPLCRDKRAGVARYRWVLCFQSQVAHGSRGVVTPPLIHQSLAFSSAAHQHYRRQFPRILPPYSIILTCALG